MSEVCGPSLHCRNRSLGVADHLLGCGVPFAATFLMRRLPKRGMSGCFACVAESRGVEPVNLLDLWWHAVAMPFAAAFPVDLDIGIWRLRTLADEDSRLEWAMSRDPEVVGWTLYPPDLTEQSARERIRTVRECLDERLAGRYVVLDSDDIAVGTAGIAGNETDPLEAEVFYALLPHGRHRGAASTAARALSDWALGNNAGRVSLITIAGNGASEAVARRACFALDGEKTR
jgi:RimJ/RimL family protein N-acetyltransferase